MLALFIFLYVGFLGLSEGAGVLPDGPVDAAIGETVLLNTTKTPPETPFVSVSWNFGVENIGGSTPSGHYIAPEYEGRATIFHSTGSLKLRSLTVADNGDYAVTIFPGSSPPESGSITLRVHVPVSNVVIDPKTANLVEFRDSLKLSCSSSGSSLSFLWIKDGSEVTASDRVQITDGGKTLTIVNVTRDDQGTYTCGVSNPVSSAASDAATVTVNSPVSNVTIEPKTANLVEFSDSLKLSCSSSGSSLSFLWMKDGSEVTASDRVQITDGGKMLTIVNVTRDDQGTYTCGVSNPVSSAASDAATVTVNSPVSNVTIEPKTANLVEFSDSLKLSCSSSGSSLSFHWIKDGSEVTASDRVQITDGGKTLTIVNVTRDDHGTWTCEVSNPVSSATSDPATLTVNYGPENVKLKATPAGSNHATGSNITMVCSAESRPSAQFSWFLNGSEPLHTGSELKLVNVEITRGGSYSCRSFNPETLRHQTSEPLDIKIFDFVAQIPGPICDVGCIVAIVITCVVVLAAALGGAFWFQNNRKKSKKSVSTTRGVGGQENSGYENEDVNYADIRFLRNGKGGSVALGLQNTSDYAEVRVNNNNNNATAASSPPTYDAHMERAKRLTPQTGDGGRQTST